MSEDQTIVDEVIVLDADLEPLDPGFDPDDLVGDTLASRYSIDDRIGRGGMGVVYLATQHTLNRKVVVKVLAKSLNENEEAMTRFEREALGLSQLQHPNIVTIYDFGRDNDMAFIVMEYVEGDTLSKFMRERKAMSFEDFAPIATQILDALSEAHDRGIIHRDIKPGNIMLCERHGHDNFVKVLDFGLAKLVHDAAEVTKKQNLVGSVAFLAPEQILGLDFDQRVDVYALGVLFYYMLSGSKPFKGEDDMAVLYQHIHKDPTHLSEVLPAGHDIPPQVIDLIHRCLSKDPRDRPKDARDFLQQLQSDASRSVFHVPWGTGEYAALALGQTGSGPHPMPPHTPAHPQQVAGQVTPHSGIVAMSPASDLSGQYASPHHMTATGTHMTGSLMYEQPGSNKGLMIIVGAILIVGLGIGGLIYSGQDRKESPDERRVRVVKMLDEVDGLVDSKQWSQAEAMLSGISSDAKTDTELFKRVAGQRATIQIGKLELKARGLEDSGDVAGARRVYAEILELDANNDAAKGRLAALLSEAATGTLKITAPLVGTAFVDGVEVGTTPVEHALSPGSHQIRVVADGQQDFEQKITVAASEVTLLNVAFVPAKKVSEGSSKTKTKSPKKTGKRPTKTSSNLPKDDKPAEEPKETTKPPKKNSGDGLLFDPGDSKKKKGDGELLFTD